MVKVAQRPYGRQPMPVTTGRMPVAGDGKSVKIRRGRAAVMDICIFAQKPLPVLSLSKGLSGWEGVRKVQSQKTCPQGLQASRIIARRHSDSSSRIGTRREKRTLHRKPMDSDPRVTQET